MQGKTTIDELMEMWAKDASMDELEPSKELQRIPKLHSKYLNMMTYHNIQCKIINKQIQELRKLKWEYYRGDLNNPEDLEKYGYEPFERKPGRDIAIYIDGDEELNKLLFKKSVNDEIVEYCKSVLKELNNRTFQVRSMIDWNKFIDVR